VPSTILSYSIVADSSTATGLVWQAASSGSYTSLASGNLNTLTTLDLQSISGSYNKLIFELRNYSMSTNSNIDVRFNNDSGTNYSYAQIYNSTAIYKEINQTSIYSAANNAAETDGQLIIEIEDYATACKHGGRTFNFSNDS